MENELTGTVGYIKFQSADGYTVLEIEGDGEPTVAVGNMPDIKVGELARFFGTYKTHPRFGRQFAVSSYESSLPGDLNGMVAFLSGGFIKGLGEALAMRIVETFGDKTFEVIQHDHAALAQVKGVSVRIAEMVHETFMEYAAQKYTYADLMGMGLTARQAADSVSEFGDGAAALIRENPYILADRIYGIDFMRADEIARSVGILKNDPMRIKSGVKNVLGKILASGDLFVERNRLQAHVADRLGVPLSEVRHATLHAALEGEIALRKHYTGHTAVFLRHVYDAEYGCAVRLMALAAGGEKGCGQTAGFEKALKKLALTNEQKDAVRLAAQSGVCVITGGPGTGKTTILKALTNVFYTAGLTYELCAPTGRAAKRMSEATGAGAQTLHRLLEYAYDEDAYRCYFRRNKENPLGADVVIADEASMIDIFLFQKLLNSLKEGARLVLVGDADQLPPVGPGNVMRDIIDADVLPASRLTHKFRNKDAIADAAFAVLQGQMPVFDERSFVFCPIENADSALSHIVDLYERYQEEGADVQVISPVKKGTLGSLSINAAIRDRVNPPAPGKGEIQSMGRVYREGDRVMQIKNNYAMPWDNFKECTVGEGVFNGDIGYIESARAGQAAVQFEDMKRCTYQAVQLGEIDWAFAYTVHKSQGSEFDIVILPMLFERSPFFTRNLLYTAITRARHKVVIVGSEAMLSYMISNYIPSRRATALKGELKYLSKTLFRPAESSFSITG